LRRFTFFIWLVMLFVVTSIPSSAFPKVRVAGFDILIHGRKNWKFFSLIVIIAIIDELHQHFIPGRSVSFFDLGADFLGGGLTFWLLKA